MSFIASVFAVTWYLTFSVLAYLRYPLPYSPLDNWLSDLGNPELSPSGAPFYNIGVVVAGLALVLFFAGLSVWKLVGNRRQEIMIYASQALGVLGAVAMVMSGLYPINLESLHGVLSMWLFVLLGAAFGFSVAALRYHSDFPRWLLVLGVITAVADVLSGIFQTLFVLEWVTVALFLGYVTLVGIATQRLSSGTSGWPLVGLPRSA